jgi:uncharacterized phage-associated protein
MMSSVFDAAQCVLGLLKAAAKLPVTTWKLQKLVYYSQAWAAVWDDEPIFPERIEAWANGPVCPALYDLHRGEFKIESLAKGNARRLCKEHKATVEAVVNFYGDKAPQYLSELTHNERPWIDARKGLKPGERGSREISVAAMAEYYGGL